ncbi:hypothetical protein GBA52_008653 [Prunus armeniaca]|nr:hypothetical protein GBA52_008653 [Prunus armeniaca]
MTGKAAFCKATSPTLHSATGGLKAHNLAPTSKHLWPQSRHNLRTQLHADDVTHSSLPCHPYCPHFGS